MNPYDPWHIATCIVLALIAVLLLAIPGDGGQA